jgi:hypothetical protein
MIFKVIEQRFVLTDQSVPFNRIDSAFQNDYRSIERDYLRFERNKVAEVKLRRHKEVVEGGQRCSKGHT